MIRKQSGISHLIFSMKQKLASILCPKMRKENVDKSTEEWCSNTGETFKFQFLITETCNKIQQHIQQRRMCPYLEDNFDRIWTAAIVIGKWCKKIITLTSVWRHSSSFCSHWWCRSGSGTGWVVAHCCRVYWCSWHPCRSRSPLCSGYSKGWPMTCCGVGRWEV